MAIAALQSICRCGVCCHPPLTGRRNGNLYRLALVYSLPTLAVSSDPEKAIYDGRQQEAAARDQESYGRFGVGHSQDPVLVVRREAPPHIDPSDGVARPEC